MRTIFEPNFHAIRLDDLMTATAEDFLRGRGFLRVTAPRIVPASGACENVGTLFQVYVAGKPHWFISANGGGKPKRDGTPKRAKKKRVYFAQTVQLYLESLLGKDGFGKLYSVGPSARAEEAANGPDGKPQEDTRHLTEFEMVEFEFRGTFAENLCMIEQTITAMVGVVCALPESEHAAYGLSRGVAHLASHPVSFPRINYSEAIEELGITWGDDISSAQEQQLVANHGQGPIFIIRYPNPESDRMKRILADDDRGKAIKFFNMVPDEQDPEYVFSADCIVPYGGECVGSASRVWHLEEFASRLYSSLMFTLLLKQDRDAKEGFAWYMEMMERYPSQPHAGCGIGKSRVLQYLLAEPDIRKVVPFPSTQLRIY